MQSLDRLSIGQYNLEHGTIKMKKPVFAIFSGGGVKAAAFVGAVNEAEARVKFLGVGGTSGGAIVATLLACGYRGDELERALFDVPYDRLFKARLFRFVWNPRGGLFDPEVLLAWLREKIAAKVSDPKGTSPRVTFEVLAKHPGALPLKVVATNITTQDVETYSAATHPKMEVARAVLASSSFPILFPAVKLEADEVVDGGVMSNFPMWLFDDEREKRPVPTPVLGFALAPYAARVPASNSPITLYTLFEAILSAQDRVQERYLATARLAEVIRVRIPPTYTFETRQTPDQRQTLVLAGRIAAIDYFDNAPKDYQDRVEAPAPSRIGEAKALASKGQLEQSLSLIVREHLLKGGVARDEGYAETRKFVRYYVDLMEAATDPPKREVLGDLLAKKIATQGFEYDRVVGIKMGNVLLAAEVAHRLQKPLALVKGDLTYKMGYPFDGAVVPDSRVVLVDDVASDASVLLDAIRQLHLHRVQVLSVVALVERTEGDAAEKLGKINCRLASVCRAVDADIRSLIEAGKDLPRGG